MKRSEMLSYLAKIIKTSGSTIGSSHIDYDALAEDVLSAVEEQGMLPPKAWVITNADNPNYPELQYIKECINAWEDK